MVAKNGKRKTHMNTKSKAPFTREISLPLDGLSRWGQIKPFSPFCREKFRQLSKRGKAPQPIRLSSRCTVYKNSELHSFFADPLSYVAGAAK